MMMSTMHECWSLLPPLLLVLLLPMLVVSSSAMSDDVYFKNLDEQRILEVSWTYDVGVGLTVWKRILLRASTVFVCYVWHRQTLITRKPSSRKDN